MLKTLSQKSKLNTQNKKQKNKKVFFFGCEKEPRSLDCPSSGSVSGWHVGNLDFPHTHWNHPWRSGARGQQKTIDKRVLWNFGTKPFLLSIVFCVAWNEKFVKSEMHLSTVALKLLTNLSVSRNKAHKNCLSSKVPNNSLMGIFFQPYNRWSISRFMSFRRGA